MKGLFILAAKRTPFGAFGGSLKDHTSINLAAAATRAVLTKTGIDANAIDSVSFGNVMQWSCDGGMALARFASLDAGLPIHVPAVTLNRLCGSGFESVVYGCREILTGDASLVLCGGSENMSEAPYLVRGQRFGPRLGVENPLEDSLWRSLTDARIKMPMGITAENLAEQYDITRQQCDEFAIRSQQLWKKANDSGAFSDELIPMEIKTKKGKAEMMTVDEHAKPESTLEKLSALRPVFKKDGTVTAANASGICDGAAALIVGSEAAAKQHSLTPLARIVGWDVVGVPQETMGIGPAPAIRNLLKKTGKRLEDIDVFDVNEAFAPQCLAVAKELGLDADLLNINGGAIAMGHPVGASGARITGHLAHLLNRSEKKLAIGAACIGGGQGIAIMLEKC